ncbi:MAG: pyruvate kinase, partial [Gammaproteobacteria bacterium]|nr:pyruvate kinase [Gammaproteobacteria bacterium]
ALSPLTHKDRQDLKFGLQLGVDWVALSFVQRPEDMDELRAAVDGRARILAKLEKPAAIAQLDAIVAASDAIMVARGDLGVELPPEQVPAIQKRILRACRMAGKPVVVATQMLDSMIQNPVPTRAEAADVAAAVYDGADAVMLSGETAIGTYPREAVSMMNRIIDEVERDPHYRTIVDAAHPGAQSTTGDAICSAMRHVASLLSVSATVAYTTSGYSTLRAARERPEAPILSLSPNIQTSRYLTLVWGVHSAYSVEINTVTEMVEQACRLAVQEKFATAGRPIVITGGMPFGRSGTTNLLRVAWPEHELSAIQDRPLSP